jgi:DNA primase
LLPWEITLTAIDEIKSRIDAVDLISESVQLRRSGKNFTGFCPFHPNTRTPAFVVFPETNTWRCFGECNDGGDIFKFVMKKEGWDFPEALRVLADRAGVELRPPTPEEQERGEEHDRLRLLLEDAVTFYRHNLLNTPAGKVALDYLHKRELSDEVIEAFGLGYAPQSWDAALNHFITKGYTKTDLLDCGLLTERDDGKVYDRFRNRVLFPIRDGRSRMTGFGARILNPDDIPKFLNSPQTTLFDKSKLLYGLDRARRSIRSKDQVIIVEGYLDVIALHQHGYDNAVSPMGTALTEHQLRLIKRFSRNIVLALDPDAAGLKATIRGLEIARQTMDRESEPVFDARGLLRHEARLQADIRVTALPDDLDPDDVVNRDPDEWEHILSTAKPIVIHVMKTLAADRDLDDPKIKSEIASQVMPLIEDIGNSIERDTYRQQLARLLRVDERTLLLRPRGRPVSRSRYRPRQTQPTDTAVSTSPSTIAKPGNIREAHCLGILLRRPDLIYHIDRNLQEDGLDRLGPQDFQQTDHQVLFRLIHKSLEQDEAEPLNFVLNNLPMPMMNIADEVLAKTEGYDPHDDKVLEDLLRALISLRQQSTRQNNDYLRFLLEDAQQKDDPIAIEYQNTVFRNTIIVQRLDKALGRYTNRSHSMNNSQSS